MSDRLLFQTSLCHACRNLRFDESCFSAESSPYARQDMYPELPEITASADKGCGFCKILKEVILDEIPHMRSAKNRNLADQVSSMVLTPKRFEIRTETVRFCHLENYRQLGAFGLHHFLIDLYATESCPGDQDTKPEELGGFDMRFDVFADPGEETSLKT